MYSIKNIKIKFEDVLVRMGANKYKTKVDSKMEETIVDSISIVTKILKPEFATCIVDKKIQNNKIMLDSFVIESKDVFDLLKDSNKICGIVATVGNAIDEKIISLQNEKKIMLAYIYDSIGSVAIEQLMDNICDDLKKTNITTMRFSPGYGDWYISNQKEFLKWLGANKIGVYISKTFQMSPRKSVSAVLGLK